MMLFSNNEKNKMLNDLNKIIKKTYTSETKSPKIDNQFIKMQEVLDYYNKKYKVDFQKFTLESLADSSYDELLNELNHERDDDKQKDEGKDIQSEDIEKNVQEQIDKSKMPSDTLDKEGIMKELSEMAEDEKNISEKDINSFVKAATIKAIYKATLEKYEQNRKEISKHAGIVLRRDGEFALEDRLAMENRQYEVYLQKLSKQYKNIDPNHKDLQSDEKVRNKEEVIRDEHNKQEETKEKKREEEIARIVLLYDEKESIEEDMARMSANPTTFDEAKFNELQDKLYKVDKELSQKPGPATLIENARRDEKQEELDSKTLGMKGNTPNAGVAKTTRENENREQINDNKIISETQESIEQSSENIEDVIKRYRQCRDKGDYEGAKEQYKILKTMSGSKENLENNVKDINDDGKEDYRTSSEKEDNLREELGIDAVNDDERTAELDLMDAEVDEMAESNGIQNEEMYKTQEENNYEPKQHTLYGNKRPY